MFKFLLSKKGFTLTEMLSVVVVLGILVGIAIPIYSGILYSQRKNDCKNNRKMIESTVKEAMTGMMDNGLPQKDKNNEFYINMDSSRTSHTTTIEYNGKKSIVLNL